MGANRFFEYSTGSTIDDLRSLAEEVQENAYAPWSRPENPRKDGVVVLTDDVRAYPGCNVENVNYTNSTGALTNAFAMAMQDGFDSVERVVVATDEIDRYTFSGKNMQVVSEFTDGNEPVTIITDRGVGEYKLHQVANPYRLPLMINGRCSELSGDGFDVPQLYHEDVEDDELIELARDASEQAYTPVSGYDVGVALRAEDGTAFVNSNKENEDIGVTVHGEDVARYFVAHGIHDFDTIVVSTPGDEPFPCGYCRQTLAEFAIDDLTVIADGADITSEQVLNELYPQSFDPTSL